MTLDKFGKNPTHKQFYCVCKGSIRNQQNIESNISNTKKSDIPNLTVRRHRHTSTHVFFIYFNCQPITKSTLNNIVLRPQNNQIMSENPIDTKPIGDGELNENSELTIKISNESKPKLLIPNGTELSREEIQLRRKHKKQLKLQKIQELKIVRRRREREKKKEKRKAEVALGIPGPNVLRKKLKQNRIDNTSNRVRVAIDLSYDELMSEKDIGKTARQLQHVYTANRKSTMPIKLFYTGIKPDSQIEIALRKYDGYKNWDIKFHEESYDEIFDANALVYLSSDSETVLQELESNAVYIIGGLVDHNAHKGLSYSRAQERGLRTARLPLCEYIEDMKTTNVLTIVHGESQMEWFK